MEKDDNTGRLRRQILARRIQRAMHAQNAKIAESVFSFFSSESQEPDVEAIAEVSPQAAALYRHIHCEGCE